jgi:hypothetical protein
MIVQNFFNYQFIKNRENDNFFVNEKNKEAFEF